MLSAHSNALPTFDLAVLRKSVALLCEAAGWEVIGSSALTILVDLMYKYIYSLSRRVQFYADFDDRTYSTIHDLRATLNDLGFNYDQMLVFMSRSSTCTRFPNQIPSIMPLRKQCSMNFLRPGSDEIVTRPLHVPEHLPPMIVATDTDTNTVPDALTDSRLKQEKSSDDTGYSSLARDDDAASGVLDEFVNHKMGSVLMTSSGYISTSVEGRQAESVILEDSVDSRVCRQVGRLGNISQQKDSTSNTNCYAVVKGGHLDQMRDVSHYRAGEASEVCSSSRQKRQRHGKTKAGRKRPMHDRHSHNLFDIIDVKDSSELDALEPAERSQEAAASVSDDTIVETNTDESVSQTERLEHAKQLIHEQRCVVQLEAMVNRVVSETCAGSSEALCSNPPQSHDSIKLSKPRQNKGKLSVFKKKYNKNRKTVTCKEVRQQPFSEPPGQPDHDEGDSYGVAASNEMKSMSVTKDELDDIAVSASSIKSESLVEIADDNSVPDEPLAETMECALSASQLLNNPLIPRIAFPVSDDGSLLAGVRPAFPIVPSNPALKVESYTGYPHYPHEQQKLADRSEITQPSFADQSSCKDSKESIKHVRISTTDSDSRSLSPLPPNKRNRVSKEELTPLERLELIECGESHKHRGSKKSKKDKKEKRRKQTADHISHSDLGVSHSKKSHKHRSSAVTSSIPSVSVSSTSGPSHVGQVPKLTLRLSTATALYDNGDSLCAGSSITSNIESTLIDNTNITTDNVCDKKPDLRAHGSEFGQVSELAAVINSTNSDGESRDQDNSDSISLAKRKKKMKTTSQSRQPHYECSSNVVMEPAYSVSVRSALLIKEEPLDRALHAEESSAIRTETVGSYIDCEGNRVWICPSCGRQDDGSPMIGCDRCDDWYHWLCVGIEVPPAPDEDWFCPRCSGRTKSAASGRASAGKQKSRGRGRRKSAH